MFRVSVDSSDGKTCAVTLQLSDHRPTASAAILNDIADRLRVSRDDIEDVLTNWSAEDLRRHLEQFTADQLRPPAHRGS